MAVWPFFMAVAAALTLWGWRVGAWPVPALALLGYVGMRGVMLLNPEVQPHVAFALWLCIAAAMVYKGGEVPGLFFALSALSYPALYLFGFRIEWMGLQPIIADALAVLALLSIGGGLLGMDPDSPPACGGVLAWLAGHSVGVAQVRPPADRPRP